MSKSNNMRTSSRSATVVAAFLLALSVMAMASRGYAQSQSQPADKELQEMKNQIAQLQSQVNYLTASVATPTTAAAQLARTAPVETTLTGRVSCAHCEGNQPLHKGHTQFSWALYSVSQGDDIVLVARDKIYKLQGNKEQLLKLMYSKAKVTGRLEGTTLETETIARAAKNE